MFELLVAGGVVFAIYSIVQIMSGSDSASEFSNLGSTSFWSSDPLESISSMSFMSDFDSGSLSESLFYDGHMMGFPGDGMPPSIANNFQSSIGIDISDIGTGFSGHMGFLDSGVDMFGDHSLSDIGSSCDFSSSGMDSTSFGMD